MLRRAEERVGTTILGTWTLTGVLGSGGVATVYRARHADGRVVALKLLHAEIADDVDIVKRLTYEARAANRLNHPGSVRIQECDVTDEGLPFLVMDLLTGCTLSERLARGTPLPLDELLRIADADTSEAPLGRNTNQAAAMPIATKAAAAPMRTTLAACERDDATDGAVRAARLAPPDGERMPD